MGSGKLEQFMYYIRNSKAKDNLSSQKICIKATDVSSLDV